MKKLIIAALLAGSFGAIHGAAQAQTIVVREAPPPPRDEVVPPPRHGYVWAPGHWEYRNHHYVWVRGSWMKERHGYRYSAPVWEQRDGQWVMRPGRWAHGDADHDGVPNDMDRHPHDPNRS